MAISNKALFSIDQCLLAVRAEIIRAKEKHPGDFHGPHEAYAIALEEVDELWDKIKKDGGGRDFAAYRGATQAAAMFVRYMAEVAQPQPHTSPQQPPAPLDTVELDD